MAFIRQRKLEDKTAKDILQIAEFGFVAWNFLTSIYELEWNLLTKKKDFSDNASSYNSILRDSKKLF